MVTPTLTLVRARVITWFIVLGAVVTLTPSAAFAELTQYAFTGVVVDVSGADPEMLDLRSTFSPGQTIAMTFTVDRAGAGYSQDPTSAGYWGVLADASLAWGSYAMPHSAEYMPGAIAICNGLLEQRDGGFYPVDIFTIQTPIPDAPGIGKARFYYVDLDLRDHEASVFSGLELPVQLPAIGEFEIAQVSLQFMEGESRWGFARAVITGIETLQLPIPATQTTWGRVKAGYRD